MKDKTMPVPAPEGTFWHIEESVAMSDYGERYYDLRLYPRGLERMNRWDKAGYSLAHEYVPRQKPDQIRRISAKMVKDYYKMLNAPAELDVEQLNKKIRYGA